MIMMMLGLNTACGITPAPKGWLLLQIMTVFMSPATTEANVVICGGIT